MARFSLRDERVRVPGISPMGLKLYCNRYAHFKDPIVCAVVCPYRTRCRDFALFYDERREETDALVADYYSARGEAPKKERARLHVVQTEMRSLLSLEVKRAMPESSFIWIGKDDQAELLNYEEIIRRAERGQKPRTIYKVSQEMELKFQLVPRKRIEKAKRIVAEETERATARRNRSRPRPVPVETPAPLAAVASAPEAAPARRTRRLAKAAGR